MGSPAEPLLKLQGAAKFFGRRLVFKDVSCAVGPGEIWLLVGANGAGKSTLLGVMAGLIRPDAGQVERHVPSGAIGYLGHKTFLYPRLTALQNLRFWADLHGLAQDDTSLMAALTRVELERAAHEAAGKFSRGMAQRLNLARVFLCRPKLLLLDEPATGLDARSERMLMDEIQRAKAEGLGLVWVSHQVRRDLALADGVIHLAAGRPTYVGPASAFVAEGGIC